MAETLPKVGDTVKCPKIYYSNEGPNKFPKERKGYILGKVLVVYPDGCLDLEIIAPKAYHKPAILEKVSPKSDSYEWGWFVDDAG